MNKANTRGGSRAGLSTPFLYWERGCAEERDAGPC